MHYSDHMQGLVTNSWASISLVLGTHIADESFHDAALMGHVRDHCDHVVVARADQCWPEHNGQVTHVHLIGVAVGHNIV